MFKGDYNFTIQLSIFFTATNIDFFLILFEWSILYYIIFLR